MASKPVAGALESHRYLTWRQGMGCSPSELFATGYCLAGCPVTHTSPQGGVLLEVGCVLSPHFWLLVIGHSVNVLACKGPRAISVYPEHAMEHKAGPQ